MDIIFIYYLHRGDGIPFYIGKTKDLKQRLREHKSKKLKIKYIPKKEIKKLVNLLKVGFLVKNI